MLIHSINIERKRCQIILTCLVTMQSDLEPNLVALHWRNWLQGFMILAKPHQMCRSTFGQRQVNVMKRPNPASKEAWDAEGQVCIASRGKVKKLYLEVSSERNRE